jgi:hypothetical protein
MNARWSRLGRVAASVVAAACCAGILFVVATLWAQRPSTERHVRELGRYLDGVKIAEPVRYRHLAVYPVLVDDVPLLRGRWLTADAAISSGALVVSEKAGGNVPLLEVENRSREEYVFLMGGEVLSGGMQTRTVRHDVVLAPGQKIDLDVFCVEAHRWSGAANFAGGSKTMLPQSIKKEVREGASQTKVWSEVNRNNIALNSQNATANLDEALQAAPVRRQLEAVRRRIVPSIPRGTTGFIFVDHGRALGLELFGSEDLARALLPKLLDSYAVDYVILNAAGDRDESGDNHAAIGLFERLCRLGSQRAGTPGSGSGISSGGSGLLGDGVSLDSTLVHYGAQLGANVAPAVQPQPVIIYPNPNPNSYPQRRDDSDQRPPLVR